MSDTLAAALVSGLLSGLVVLTGVVLAEALRRRSDLRERQRRLVFDLVGELGRHERALRTQPAPDNLADQHAVVMSALFELRNITRSTAVRHAADESIARTQEALQRSLAGRSLPVTASLGGPAARHPATNECRYAVKSFRYVTLSSPGP